MNDRADFFSNVLNNDQSSLFSSTLQELHINVYLLDGRLNQLCILIINVFHILPLRSSISDQVNYVKRN
jgi:type III secretory pathway component EscT